MAKKLDLITPGEILKEEFLIPLDLSATRLAELIGVPTNRITGIINGTRSITGDTAARLGRLFRTSTEFWLNLQANYDARLAERTAASALRSIKPWPQKEGRLVAAE